MSRPTVHSIAASILAAAKIQRATAPTITVMSDLQSGTYEAALATDSLLDKIARNAAQGLAVLLQPPRAAAVDEDRCDFGDPQCPRAATHAASGDELDEPRRLCADHAAYVAEVYGSEVGRVIPTWTGEMKERTPRRLCWDLKRGTMRARVIATFIGGRTIGTVIVTFSDPTGAPYYVIAEAARFAASLFDHIGDRMEDNKRDARDVLAAAEVGTFQIPAGRVDVTGPDALLLVSAFFVDPDCDDDGIDLVHSARHDLLGSAV